MAGIRKPQAEIEAAVAYPLEVFRARTGLGQRAIDNLKRRGMPVRKCGRTAFILGGEFIAALKGENDDAHD
jgi:hypothetical protein